jgi:hypothetical protein
MSNPATLFCDAFIDAVYGAVPTDPTVCGVLAQPGFTVYRNTIFKACVDALAANYPAVERLAGAAWFREAALDYARGAPPTCVSLIDYGAGFPAFLDDLDSARTLPYLGAVAHIEQMWMGAHTAADQQVLDQAHLARLAPADLGRAVLAPHASARWTWCEAMPVVSIWRANRSPGETAAQPEWRGEGVLFTRPRGAVAALDIGPGAAAFLDACAGGATLQDAAAGALGNEPGLDLAVMLSALLDAGAFRASDPTD